MNPDAHGASLRDRYFAAREGRLDDEERRRLRADVDACEAAPVALVEGMGVSFHPTARFKALRFIEDASLAHALRGSFAHPCADAPSLAAVFVDPEEYHFRTFENVIPLDRLFERAALDVAPGRLDPMGPNVDAWTFPLGASPEVAALLGRLDGLGLYVDPLNAASRGGRRFIFHAARLAEALTRALRGVLSEEAAWDFHHVNPVFRCNRFDPGDAPFRSHLDAPYYDASRGHVSRFTLLVYLTGGRGAPALRVEGAALESIAPMTCVLFDQRHAHEGAAYLDGAKVFLRTELVFEDDSLDHAPDIARLFSSACYLVGESVFAPELARYADDAFDRVARAHREGLDGDGAEPAVFVHKRFRGVDFVANGYDFWFRAGALSLEECAAVTLLDYFNCRVGDAAFRARCESVVLTGRRGSSWIGPFLAGLPGAPAWSPFGALDREGLFPPPERVHAVDSCPRCDRATFDATRNCDVIDAYESAQSYANGALERAAVMIMGEELFLERKNFVVRDGKIHVLSPRALEPVHFAACQGWCHTYNEPADYVAADRLVDAPFLLVPPILFAERDGCWHLMLDLFRNSWMVSVGAVPVIVPRITREPPQREAPARGPFGKRF